VVAPISEADWKQLQAELQQARLEAQKLSAALADTWEELTLLYELAEQLRGVLDIDQAVRLALEHVTDIVSVEGCAVLLKEDGEWEVQLSFCPNGHKEWLSAWGNEVAQHALQRRRGFILNDLSQHPEWGEKAKIFALQNLIVVPLNPDGHAKGALMAWNKLQGEFTSGI